MSQILVTGASGGLGRAIVETLLKRVLTATVVALARDAARVADLARNGAEIRIGHYHDPASLRRAFEGIDKLLLVSAPAFTDAVTQHANVIDAAKAAGVRHIHYTAIQHPTSSSFEIPQVTVWDRSTERMLENSGLEVTILRNTLYVDTLPALFGKAVDDRAIRAPAGQGRAALASRQDLAEGAAAVLASNGHEGKTYTFSGSRAVDLNELAVAISSAIGASIRYEDISARAYIAERVAEGVAEPFARFAASWFQAVAAGEFHEVTGDLERLLGRPPRSPERFLTEVYSASRSSRV